MKNILFILCGFVFSITAMAQQVQVNQHCATPAIKTEWLSKYQSSPSSFPLPEKGMLFVPITVHVVGTDEGLGFFPADKVLTALCVLNEDFLDSEIQFYLKGPIRYLANSNYYEHNFQGGAQMMNNNNVYGSINCYIVQDPAGACGYYSFGGDAVALKKGCIGPADHTWAHEIGHFLSLPHTFFGWENLPNFDYTQEAPNMIDNTFVERANGSNCAYAADGFCDTPADYLNYRWACDVDSRSTLEQIDPQGNTFKSDGNFFMSYSLDNCTNKFSNEQINAMRANLEYQRPELLTNQNTPVSLSEETDLLSPEDESSVAPDLVNLRWKSVVGADYYIVEVSRLSNFPFLTHQEIVSDTTFQLLDLTPDKQYYWRIRPFGKYDFACETNIFSTYTFTTDGSVNTISPDVFAPLTGKIFPNPSSQNEPAQLQLTAIQPTDFTLRVFDSIGQLIMVQSGVVNPGLQSIALQIPNGKGGFYFVEINDGQKVSVIPWVVNQ